MVLLAGFSAACNSSRFSHPLLTGSTDQSTPGSQMPPEALPPPSSASVVTRADLPPPPANTGAGAYGWTAVGGQVIRVSDGESLDYLAGKYGVPRGQILSANQLASAADVQAGRVIVIPVRAQLPPTRSTATAAPAPITPARMVVADAGPGPDTGTSTYVVKSGDTLFSISRRSGMKPTEIAAMNGISTDSLLHVGQKLRLNGSAATFAASAGPGAPPKPLGTLKVKQTPPARVVMNPQPMPTIPVTNGDEPAAAAVSAADVDNAVDPASADGKSFRWPVRGRIISGFGSKPNGERNDGINLAVPEGTSVKAAEAGTVIYAGNELAGYGNLVLIRHANGWVTAYAHNKDMMVKRGETVRRGQVIAHAGMTGSVNAPQVHFELRKGAKPVNPLDYLAGV